MKAIVSLSHEAEEHGTVRLKVTHGDTEHVLTSENGVVVLELGDGVTEAGLSVDAADESDAGGHGAPRRKKHR